MFEKIKKFFVPKKEKKHILEQEEERFADYYCKLGELICSLLNENKPKLTNAIDGKIAHITTCRNMIFIKIHYKKEDES